VPDADIRKPRRVVPPNRYVPADISHVIVNARIPAQKELWIQIAKPRDNEKKIGAFIQDKMAQWFMAAGARTVERGPAGTMGPSTHAYGGTRMGDNRETNVVNRFGFAHEVPNLGILGASVMGTSGARNPTLTAQALAWRTAEHLRQNWGTIAH
jgi:choline dehydrogenase-like flavoprotein